MDVFRTVSVCVFFCKNKDTNICCLIIKKECQSFLCTDQPVCPTNIYPFYDKEFKEYLQGGAELLKGQVVQKSKW